MTNNGNMQAMPCEVVEQYHIDASQAPKGAPTPRERKVMSSGMTKREIMAMNIASGIIASGYDATFEATAGCAVRYTDALLAELERTK